MNILVLLYTTDVVSFTVDRKDPDAPEMDWWKRIRRVRIEDQPDKVMLDAWYTYSRNLDLRRSQRSFASNLASFSMLKRNSATESTFSEDIWEAITTLNDNDLFNISQGSFENLSYASYEDIQRKKKRQLKSILK